MSKVEAISVTRLCRRIRNVLEIEVGEVWVKGEVSNLRKQASGHWYFSLKDEGAQISCAMFGARRRPGAESIEDGAKVQVFGELSFYEARGSTQLIVRKAQAVGVGNLQAQFEALKKKLHAEGLFAAEKKKPLPFFPKTIGLVTSPTGAALQDMLNVLKRRAPWVTVVLFPVSVQGKGAERDIAASILEAAEHEPRPEVLIVGRGGGSLEDLWNFNEEVVARAISQCEIPVVSAVGHEIDFTISDLVADLRAPTPSAAAELVVPDREELLEQVSRVGRRLQRQTLGNLERLEERVDRLAFGVLGQSAERVLREPKLRLEQAERRLAGAVKDQLHKKEIMISHFKLGWQRFHPTEVLKRRQERLDRMRQNFQRALHDGLAKRERKLERCKQQLHLLSPELTLRRGYSMTLNEDGEVVTDASTLKKGDEIVTRTAGGSATSVVL